MMDDLNEMLLALERGGAVVLKAPQSKQDRDVREPADEALAANPY